MRLLKKCFGFWMGIICPWFLIYKLRKELEMEEKISEVYREETVRLHNDIVNKKLNSEDQ